MRRSSCVLRRAARELSKECLAHCLESMAILLAFLFAGIAAAQPAVSSGEQLLRETREGGRNSQGDRKEVWTDLEHGQEQPPEGQ
jgi:hypothetical protein